MRTADVEESQQLSQKATSKTPLANGSAPGSASTAVSGRAPATNAASAWRASFGDGSMPATGACWNRSFWSNTSRPATGRAADLEHAVVGLHEHLSREAVDGRVGEDLSGDAEQAAAPPRSGELAFAFGDLVGGHRWEG